MNNNNTHKRMTTKYSLIRVLPEFKYNCIIERETGECSRVFRSNSLYTVLRYKDAVNVPCFDALSRLCIESGIVELKPLVLYARNKGVDITIKPLKGWLDRFPELVELGYI